MGWGKNYTWKIVYNPKVANGGMQGVALVEACTEQEAMFTFCNQYAGQFTTVNSCKKLFEQFLVNL